MKPFLCRYNCGNCGNTFKEPSLLEVYGEFIMRSNKTNDSAYLNGFDDPVFQEVADLFDNNEMIKNTARKNDSVLFQTIFSVSCDLASDGGQYQMDLLPICPNCGSRKMASWDKTYPLEFSEEDVKPVQHESWTRLSHEEKKDLINQAIKAHL